MYHFKSYRNPSQSRVPGRLCKPAQGTRAGRTDCHLSRGVSRRPVCRPVCSYGNRFKIATNFLCSRIIKIGMALPGPAKSPDATERRSHLRLILIRSSSPIPGMIIILNGLEPMQRAELGVYMGVRKPTSLPTHQQYQWLARSVRLLVQLPT